MRKYSGRERDNIQRSLSEMTNHELLSFVVNLLEEHEELNRKVLQLSAKVSDYNWTLYPDHMGSY